METHEIDSIFFAKAILSLAKLTRYPNGFLNSPASFNNVTKCFSLNVEVHFYFKQLNRNAIVQYKVYLVMVRISVKIRLKINVMVIFQL